MDVVYASILSLKISNTPCSLVRQMIRRSWELLLARITAHFVDRDGEDINENAIQNCLKVMHMLHLRYLPSHVLCATIR